MEKTILVVDDSATMRQLIGLTLKKVKGCHVVEAQNGVDAVGRLGAGAFDLIITDIKMPEMDGLELVRQVRGPLGHAALPIIIVTTKGEEATRDAGLQAGANAYLTKPLSGVQLVDLVERLTAAPNGAGAGREG
jgi:two-component system chemotaxis response regulator CheY